MSNITFLTLGGSTVEVSRSKYGVHALVNGSLKLAVVGETTHNGAIAIEARAMPKIVTLTGPEESIRAVLALKAEHDADVQRDIESNRAYTANYDRVLSAMEG